MKEKRKQKKPRPSNPSPAIARFLNIWRGRKWEALGDALQITYTQTNPGAWLEAATILAGLPLEKAKVLKRINVSPVLVDYHVACEYTDGREPEVRIVRMVCELSAYEPDRCGTWGVNPISVYRTLGGGEP